MYGSRSGTSTRVSTSVDWRQWSRVTTYVRGYPGDVDAYTRTRVPVGTRGVIVSVCIDRIGDRYWGSIGDVDDCTSDGRGYRHEPVSRSRVVVYLDASRSQGRALGVGTVTLLRISTGDDGVYTTSVGGMRSCPCGDRG